MLASCKPLSHFLNVLMLSNCELRSQITISRQTDLVKNIWAVDSDSSGFKSQLCYLFCDLVKLLNFSKLQFPHLQNGNTITYIERLW